MEYDDASEVVLVDALHRAIARGIADLDAGNGIEVRADGLRDYLRERGRLATERVKARAAEEPVKDEGSGH